MRHALALAAAGLLVALLPAVLLVAHGPRAVSLSGRPVGAPGPVGAAGVSPVIGGPAGSAGGQAGTGGRVQLPDPASGFRTFGLAAGRRYVLHLPPPALARTAAPVVIVLPGLHNTWRYAEQAGGWSRYADRHGFLLAYGVGVDASWNAGSCCGSAQRYRVDDVGYLVRLVEDLATRARIDQTRVYLVGFSVGDMMAIRAECERPDVFAAAGGSSGAVVSPCRAPAGQVRVRHLHGRYDGVVPYRGGYSRYTRSRFPSAGSLARLLAAGSPHPVVRSSTLACGHVWPRRDNACRVDGTDLIWQWISRFSREPAPARARQLP